MQRYSTALPRGVSASSRLGAQVYSHLPLCFPVLKSQKTFDRTSMDARFSSCLSMHIMPGCFPYPVANGLLGLTRAPGIGYPPKGIRVNAIAPGYIETRLNVDDWNGFAEPHAERQRAFDLMHHD